MLRAAEHRSLVVDLVQRAFSDKLLVVSSLAEERKRSAGGASSLPVPPA